MLPNQRKQEAIITKPKVTVLMSVYNGERYLREAVDSILNQTFKDFEFIIINDGSTDKTQKFLYDYNDPRIKIINNKENIGLTRSLNKGLRAAKGEYIARQDADDISAPERLRTEVNFLEKHKNHAVVGTSVKIIDEDSVIIGLLDRPTKDEQIRKILEIRNCINHGSTMIRRTYLNKVGQYDENMLRSQDYDLWLRVLKKYLLANIPEYLYLWRKHADNIEAKNLIEQNIFVALAKVKNRISDAGKVAVQFINVTTYKIKNFKGSSFNTLFKLIQILTLNRIKVATLYCLLYRLRFSKKITKILKDFEKDKISYEEANLRMKDINNDILS